jgi:hypothetical protein
MFDPLQTGFLEAPSLYQGAKWDHALLLGGLYGGACSGLFDLVSRSMTPAGLRMPGRGPTFLISSWSRS